jgi:translation elongation factor P/translation initiation factor 5A
LSKASAGLLIPSLSMPAANDLRKGMAIRYNGNPAIVLDIHHRTPGNLRAFVQCIIRYIGTGKSADIRFSSTEKVDVVDVIANRLSSVTAIIKAITSWTRPPMKQSL